MLPPAFVDVAGPLDSAVPVCNCHRRRNSLPGPGKFNTVHHSSPGHAVPVNSSSNVPTNQPVAAATAPPQPVPEAAPVVQDVPEQYIVDQLHRLGAFYWHKPETTDCTIQVPTDQRRLSRTPNFNLPTALTTGVFATRDLDVRRGSEPIQSHGGAGPRTLNNLKLHQFYLTAQSSLLRALFSGSSVLGLVSAQHAQSQYGRRDSMPNSSKIPRLLPSSAHHPTLYLPLPDPSSFPHIVHFMYFGSPAFIEEGLLMGTIKWEGVVRNVEYLGLFEGENGIRKWLAAWRQHQLLASHQFTVIQQQQQQQQYQYAGTGLSAQNAIVLEESDEESNTNTSFTDSEDEEDTEGGWSSAEEWDPTVLALAGMQIADPFSLDVSSYRPPMHIQEQGPGPLEVL